MVTQEMKQKYAALLIRRGINLQKDQMLVIRSEVDNAPFVRLCVEEAYKAGASSVEVEWADADIAKMHYLYKTKENLAEIPQWIYDRQAREHDMGAAYLRIVSEAPNMLDGTDPDKVQTYNSAYMNKMRPLREYLMNNEGQWCIAGLPSMAWAKCVFPELPEGEAFSRLENAIYAVTGVSEENDPIADWEAHDTLMAKRAEKLNALHFDRLHFKNSLGTDLTVKLVEEHIWCGGGSFTIGGVFFDPNMPTEEIFTMPHKEGTEGIVYASKPLSFRGKVIEDFWLRFEKGTVVAYGAEKEETLLGQLLDFDEGSKHLGEVALVPHSSPISASGILFFNTLYDENASCHLALGDSYPENLKGGEEMREEERAARGANSSMQHEDFMFGTEDLSVDGILPDGRKVPVFRNGEFVIE